MPEQAENPSESPTPSLADTSSPASKMSIFALIFNILAFVIIAVSIFFRIWHLGNIPGLNGDETFFGANAIIWLQHGKLVLKTPNGNPVDPFLQIPAILLALVHGPSTILLRLPAVIYGVLAIVVAASAGRKILGPATGTVFTLFLAVLPENIIQSRFGWEPSQSVLATTITLFCCLMIVKDTQRSARWCAWSILALVCGVICHPTNIFIAVFLLVAIVMRYQATITPLINPKVSGIKAVGLWIFLIALIAGGIYWRTHATAGEIKVSYDANSTFAFVIFFSRLLSGITGLRYIAGSWLLGEVSPNAIYELDLSTLAVVLITLSFGLWQATRKNPKLEPSDKLLFYGTALLIIGFYAVAGARALTIGNERFGLVLIAPIIASVCKAFDLMTNGAKVGRTIVALAALILSCSWLVMFYNGYFMHIEQTAGTSSLAFLTGPTEPKLAAWREIEAEDNDPGHIGFVVTSTWWNSSPLTYFAHENRNNKLIVARTYQLKSSMALQEVTSARALGRVWYVEFAGSQELADLKARLDIESMTYTQKVIVGYANVPIDVVIHVLGPKHPA